MPRQTALERAYLSRMYLAHPEPESKSIMITIIIVIIILTVFINFSL